MSKAKNSPKRVVKTVKTTGVNVKKKAASSVSKASRSANASENIPLIFNKQNYILMGVGVGFMVLGFILMAGGATKLGEPFNADAIYSFRRITLAPFLIIVGLLVEVYAIFKK